MGSNAVGAGLLSQSGQPMHLLPSGYTPYPEHLRRRMGAGLFILRVTNKRRKGMHSVMWSWYAAFMVLKYTMPAGGVMYIMLWQAVHCR
jgi:hypothetical protein